MSLTTLNLREWETATPATHPSLAGLSFGEDQAARDTAGALSDASSLQVRELLGGISVEASSFVGSLQLGPLQLGIQPKLPGPELLSLLRYAYGLRDLELFHRHPTEIMARGFQDILLSQLAAEAQELLSRGLHRRYRPIERDLASPRGAIQYRQLIRRGGVTTATLPCRYHERLEDCLPNQVLLAGLRDGSRLAGDLALRSKLRRLAGMIEPTVSAVPLDQRTMHEVDHTSDRLTWAYRPAFELISLLIQGQGVAAEVGRGIRIQGFLFDMNLFFQALLAQFLSEHLPGFTVQTQHRLRGMIAYVPGYNPFNRRSPEPRPDFLVSSGRRILALLDAKYRDLAATPLPRDMLYQLAMYALSSEGAGSACILYPALQEGVPEARLEV